MGFFGTTAISGGGSGGGITQEELDLQLATKVDVVNGKGLSTNDYTTAEKTKLSGIATSANNYVHPTTHPASVIVQDASNRFVTDTEKATWNGKADNVGATTTTLGLVKKCEAQADSEATDIDTLKADFNSLLTKLKSAGLM